jgi:hypothetical protein
MDEITFDYFQGHFDEIMKVLEHEERGYFVMTPDGNKLLLLPVNQSPELKALIATMQNDGAIEEFE